MNFSYLKPLAFLFAAALGSFGSARADNTYTLDRHDVDLTIEVPRRPIFPQTLLHEGYSRGKVKVVIEIDHMGELRDWLAVESTHPDFTESIARVISSWRFSPPHISGENRSIVTSLTIDFHSSGNVLSFDLASGYSTVRFNEIVGFRVGETRLAKVAELDAAPRPVARVKPSIPQEVIEQHDGASALFTFYVDESGKVRIPALQQVNGSPEPGMLLAAQDALAQWRFDPPKSKDRPVNIKLSQSFVFTSK